jgi:hypothetical protein
MRDALTRFFRRHPWLAWLLLAALLVFLIATDTARLFRAWTLLGPNTFSGSLEIGVVVALVFLALLVVARQASGRLRTALAIVVFGGWIVAFAWEHPRYAHGSLTSSPDVVMTIAGDLPFLLLGAIFLFSRAAGLRWTPAARPAPVVSGHTAEVWYVVDNQKRPTFDPYFIAHCSCDWTGTARSGPQAQQEAFRDARSHTPDVTKTVQRPLG